MPRELVHWAVLEKARLGLAPESKTAELLTDYAAAAQLGAVMHDAPYFIDLGRGSFMRAAEILHGKYPADPTASLKECVEKAHELTPGTERDELLSFLFGMFSHAITDYIFHPYVFYFTGDYHAKDLDIRREAQRAHRAFEVYLDSWVVTKEQKLFEGMSFGSSRYIKTREKNCVSVSKLYSFLDKELTPRLHRVESEFEKGVTSLDDKSFWESSTRSMICLQRFFLSTPGGAVAKLLARLFPGQLASLEALFLLGRKEPLPELLVPQSYRNPISGEEESHSAADLFVIASEKVLELAVSFDAFILEPATLVKFLSDFHFPSLNYGVINGLHRDAKYFTPLKNLV